MDKTLFKSYILDYMDLLSAYFDKRPPREVRIDNEKLSFYIKLSKFHSLSALLYKAIKETEVFVDESLLKQLEESYYANVRKCLLFDNERKELYKYLNDNKIDYLPLKGIIIKEYYPDPSTREFADNDILFDDKGKTIVRDFFKSRGYEIKQFNKSNHDVYLKKPFFNFEMHRVLFEKADWNKTVLSYYDNLLSQSPIKEGYEHELKLEDFYLYFTMHSYKHYQGSGCGLRTLVDYYLFLKGTNLDFAYINKELESLGFLDFSLDIIELVKGLFGSHHLTDKQEELLLYIASSGTYGTIDHSVSKGVKKKGKLGYIMSRVFPPISAYKILYPWAYKHHILIPIAWFLRLCRGLFKQHGKTKNELKSINKHKKDKNV